LPSTRINSSSTARHGGFASEAEQKTKRLVWHTSSDWMVASKALTFCLPPLMVEILARRDYILTDKVGEVAFVLSSGTKTSEGNG